MRDKNLNFIQFSQSVERFVTQKLTNFSKDRRTPVADNPTFLSDFDPVLPRKFNEIRNLCIIHYYIPDEIVRWKLFLALEEKIKFFDLKKQLELKLYLSSKEKMLIFLYETKKFSSHEIFGSILGEGCRDLDKVNFKRRRTRVRKPQRKRGYDDKGSLRPREKWLERFDYSFTVEQIEKEKKLDLHLKTLIYLEKYLERIYQERLKEIK